MGLACMLEWSTEPLINCLAALIDYRGKSPKRSATGIPVLSAKVVKSTGLIRPIEQTIAPEYYPTWMTRGLPQPGDVVMTTEAPMGEVIQLDKETSQFALGQRVVCLRGKPERLDNTFLRYLLTSPQQQEIMVSYATGTTVLGISQKALRAMPIRFPDLGQQHRIAQVLAALDDKIDCNRRMNETLEAMARAMFKDWFVDFGPTKAKMEGRAPHLAPEIWDLFPDRLDDDGKPEGWETIGIGEEIELLDNKRIPLSACERASRSGKYPYHGATGIMDYVDDYLFDEVLLLLGEDGSVVRPDGHPYTQYVWGKIWVNNHAHVIKGKTLSVEQLKCFFDLSDIAPYVTGAVQPKLNQGNLKRIKFTKASSELHMVLDRIISPLFSQIRFNTEETKTLAQTRDLLLPKLMSGEIRVRDAERAVEEAL